MSSLTIRNLDDRIKSRLRVRAASRGHSMEEEARQILGAALIEAAPSQVDLATRIRRRFSKLGDVRLRIEQREPIRDITLSDRATSHANRRLGNKRRS